MVGRISQEVVEAEVVATPKARISQEVVEVEAVGTPKARVSQEIVEAEAVGTPKARVSQEVVEVEVVATPHARVSQIIVEALIANLEVDMPPVYPTLIGLGYSVIWRPQFYNMPTAKAASGAEIDLAISANPLHQFELTYDFLRDKFGTTELRSLLGFFLRMQGNFGRFLFKNPDDFQVTNQFVATTDGVNHLWTLPRTFGDDANSGTEPVGYVDLTQQFNLYLNGVLQAASTYSVLTTSPVNQQVSFNGTPGAGQAITVDMNYFYYCKFADPTMDLEKFLDRIWLAKKVLIQSNRAGT